MFSDISRIKKMIRVEFTGVENLIEISHDETLASKLVLFIVLSLSLDMHNLETSILFF